MNILFNNFNNQFQDSLYTRYNISTQRVDIKSHGWDSSNKGRKSGGVGGGGWVGLGKPQPSLNFGGAQKWTFFNRFT